MKNKILIYAVAILFMGWHAGAQSSKAAARYFNEFDYSKAASLYGRMVESGDSTQVNLERLGDSYYNLGDTQQSEAVYGALLQKYPSADAVYRFKYAQSLQSNGKQDLAGEQFETFFQGMGDDELAKSYIEGIDVDNQQGIPLPKNFKGANMNSALSDFTGYYHKDTLYWFSTSNSTGNKTYKWNDQPYLDIKASKVDAQGNISESLPKALTQELNTKYHEATLCITKDGKTMFFTRDNYNGGRLKKGEGKTTHLKLYRADKIDGKWDNVKELSINNADYSVGHPALNQDESLLYFVSDMPGSIGGTDIYKVNMVNHNVLEGTVSNLGKGINTVGDEMFPFVDAEGDLFFASNGHPGYGLLDVFVATPIGDRFGAPKNMGEPINSNRDDFGFVSFDQKGFVSSNREGGMGDDDIYTFGFEKCNNIIQGIVYDKQTQKPLANATVKLLKANGEEYASTTSGPSGGYQFDTVECFENIHVFGEIQDYRPDKALLELNGGKVGQDLYLTPLIIDNQIVLKPIYFDFDKWDIRSDAAYELENIVTVMDNHSTMVIAIESHTDSRGNDHYNESLSDKRAKSTRDYLLSRGISGNRIQSAIGYGESQLLNNCSNGVPCSDEEHQLNRRSVFKIVHD